MILRLSLLIMLAGIAWLSLTPKVALTVGNDKISHFIAYGALMWNTAWVTLPVYRRFVWGILCALAFGALMEAGQHFVPGRDTSLLDMVANAGGVAVGAIIGAITYSPGHRLLRKAGIIR